MKRRGGIWLFIALALLVTGLFLRQGPLVLVAALLVLVEILTRLWERYGLEKVVFHRHLSARRVFCGEEVRLDIEVTNGKLLPLPWLEIEDEIPFNVTLLTGKTTPSPNPGRMEIVHFFPLMWYEKVTRRYRVGCPQRGLYTFGPTRLSTGDLFGLTSTETKLHEQDSLIVYPKIVPLENLGIPSAHLFGEVRTKKRIFEDPVLAMGVRDYQSGDSLKRIHWKSSARLGKLQTKLFEPTTTMDFGIFFDVRTTMPPFYGTIPLLTELGIVTAASLSYYAMLAGYRVGLYVNERRYQAKEAIAIPPSQHPEQLPRILENLAKIDITPNECMPMPALVLREGTSLPWGSTLVVISAAPTEGLITALQSVRRAGRVVALILVGSETPPSRNSLSVYRVSDGIPWNDLKSLSFSR
ncbi:MAG: DUF58 domain-containing protein [Dehalococcoidia bacterium]|nr:DUF58 domain-containing protein [Dehalococcoidia bacterium]